MKPISPLRNVVSLAEAPYDATRSGRVGLTMAGGLGAVLISERTALLRFLRARGAGDEAEDILQELWLKLNAFDAAGPIADPRSYLFRMADNLMHDHVRAAMRRSGRERSWSELSHPDPAIGDSASPERQLASRQRLGHIELALATLGARSQAIFRRFRLEGIGQRQIAQEQGISVSAVEKHLQRAYALLASLVEEVDDAQNVRARERSR